MALIQHADVLVSAAAGARHYVGYGYIGDRLDDVLPSIINPEKERGGTDYVFWVYGLREWGTVSHVTPTLVGEAFVIDGWRGLFLLSFPVFFVYLILFKKVGFRMTANVWSVYLFVKFIHMFTETGVLGNIFHLVRTLPTDLLLIGLLILATDHLLPRSTPMPTIYTPLQRSGPRR